MVKIVKLSVSECYTTSLERSALCVFTFRHQNADDKVSPFIRTTLKASVLIWKEYCLLRCDALQSGTKCFLHIQGRGMFCISQPPPPKPLLSGANLILVPASLRATNLYMKQTEPLFAIRGSEDFLHGSSENKGTLLWTCAVWYCSKINFKIDLFHWTSTGKFNGKYDPFHLLLRCRQITALSTLRNDGRLWGTVPKHSDTNIHG
jgi:hypothetical protein